MMFKPIILLLSLSAVANCYSYRCNRVGNEVVVHSGIYNFYRTSISPTAVTLFRKLTPPTTNAFGLENEATTDGILTTAMTLSMDGEVYMPGDLFRERTVVANQFFNLASQSNQLNNALMCSILDVRGCEVGAFLYRTYHGTLIGTRNANPREKGSNVTYGFHPVKNYQPPTSVKLPPQNGLLCKRSDNYHILWRCRAPHTMITGDVLRQGEYLLAPAGHKLALQTDGNLCATGNDGKKYWCFSGAVAPIPGPYEMHVERDGNICFYGKGGKSYGCGTKSAPNSDYDYRLSLQNDGNIVTYDFRGKAVSATGTNNYKYDGPHDCPAL